MREIKFRVWASSEDEMVNWEELVADHYKFDEFNVKDGLQFMQYTGLKDKNGKEIYEGDILFNGHDRDKNHEVLWSGYNGCWSLGDEDSYPMRIYAAKDYWEVVGNIYENPELLKEQ